MRKLLGYMFILALPPLSLQSVQTAFVPGAHACGAAHLLLRVAELSREWDKPACVAQLDLKKAFDHVSHVAAFDAMNQQKVPLAAQALIAKLWDITTVVGKLGRETSSPINLDRGLPQGAPESPIIFTMVVEMVIRRVMGRWRARGAGWELDGVWVSCACYADDLVLVSSSPRLLARMCNDLIEEFRLIGLGVGAEKTHWTSNPPMPSMTLEVDGCRVAWEPNLTFVGTVVDMSGTSGPAMSYRMTAATRKLEQWRSILLAPWLAMRCRAELAATNIMDLGLVVCTDMEYHQSTACKFRFVVCAHFCKGGTFASAGYRGRCRVVETSPSSRPRINPQIRDPAFEIVSPFSFPLGWACCQAPISTLACGDCQMQGVAVVEMEAGQTHV